MSVNVTCYKGVSATDWVQLPLDPAEMLSQVRTQLTGDGFLPSDQPGIAYRFVAMQSDTSAAPDALVSLDAENIIPLAGVLRAGSVLVCTNTLAQRKPDLVGVVTDRFADRNVQVQVALNYSDPEAAAANRAAGATQLLVLHDVRLTSNATGSYDNVCVCIDGSVVGFNLTAWGGAGFQYYAGADAGEPIVNGDLNICLGDSPNRYATAAILRYSTHPSSIQIRGTASLGIPGAETLRFQKVTFRARNIRAYMQGFRVFASDQNPPPPVATSGFSTLAASAIDTVPGGSITPGTPAPGPQSNQQFGMPIEILAIDDWVNALGEVVVYFFVFPDWQIADTVIRGINATPSGSQLI